jgi:hypothetical protein
MTRIGAILAQVVFGTLFVLLCQRFACAQYCADLLQPTVYQCRTSTCYNKITTYTPEDGFEFEYDCGTIYCCGQLFSTCTKTVDGCDDGNDPSLRRRIAQAAEDSRVLVADCRGRYKLFRVAPDARLREMYARIDDRLLR